MFANVQRTFAWVKSASRSGERGGWQPRDTDHDRTDLTLKTVLRMP